MRRTLPSARLLKKYFVHVNDIYNWKKKLFENAAAVFENKSNAVDKARDKKIEAMEAKLKKNQDAINWLLSENIELKKNIDGEI